MTNPDASDRSDRHRPFVGLAFRMTGLTGVVLGGWCLWLAFSSTNKTLDVQAQHKSGNPTKAAPVVHITGVTATSEDVETAVTTAAVDGEESANASIQLLGGSSEPAAHELSPTHPARKRSADNSAAWLTGTIDEPHPAAKPRLSRTTQIPAWKRSSAPSKRVMGPALPLGQP